jgi:hypothetical protein
MCHPVSDKRVFRRMDYLIIIIILISFVIYDTEFAIITLILGCYIEPSIVSKILNSMYYVKARHVFINAV